MPELLAPSLALRWLRRVRWAVLLSELAFVALSRAELLDPLPLGPIGLVCAAVVGVDLLQAGVLTRRPGAREAAVGLHVVFDLLALSFLVALSPDAHQPMQVFFIVEPAVAATVLSPRRSVIAAIGAASLQALAVLAPGAARHDPEFAHLASHAALLGFATLTTTGFVAQLAAALRDRTEALRRAELGRVATERLAALGTLAAGVAHELATPLGAIGILADETVLPEATVEDRQRAHGALHGELVRCRDLLRRLKTGPGELDAVTSDLDQRLREWVAEWQRGNGQSPVAISITAASPTVRGTEDRWRAALWTVLDNARRAGGSEPIEVGLHEGAVTGTAYVEVHVSDAGCGLDPEVAAHAGEPFFSAWLDGSGQGLGLFAARTFARAVGGDLELAPRAGPGVCAILRLPLETR